MIVISLVFVFLLMLTLINLLLFGYAPPDRQDLGNFQELFREDRFYAFVVIGYSLILGLRLLISVLKML